MKLFDVINNIFSSKKKSKNTLCPEELRKIQKSFVDILSKYTSISSTVENIDESMQKKHSGLFDDKFECSLLSTHRGAYAIRFKDDMTPEEFNQVFDLLKNDMGNPDIFSEYDGYVWTREGYIVSLGLVALGYKYEVPMICVYNDITEFSSAVDYKEYAFIADSINKPLIARKIKEDRKSFYPIAFGKSFDDRHHPQYMSIDNLQNAMVYVLYKEKKIELCVIPLVPISELDDTNSKNRRLKQDAAKLKDLSEAYPESELRVSRPQDKHTKFAMISDISIIEEKLNQFLEETKDYYETK